MQVLGQKNKVSQEDSFLWENTRDWRIAGVFPWMLCKNFRPRRRFFPSKP
jgi:hypothetical protein